MAREWYVFKLGKREDTSRERFALNQQAQPRPIAARGGREGRRANREGVFNLDFDAPIGAEQPRAEPVEGVETGHGFTILRADMGEMNVAFTTEEAAERWAKEQAEKNPKTLYGIYSCVKVFETTTPTVIEKMFNDAGELLVRQ